MLHFTKRLVNVASRLQQVKWTILTYLIAFPQRISLSHLNWVTVKHVRVGCVTYMKYPALAAVAWTGAHIWAHPDTHRNVWMFFPGSKCGFHIPHSSLAFCVLSDFPKIQCQPTLTHYDLSVAEAAQRQITHERILNQLNCRPKPLCYATTIAPFSSSSLREGSLESGLLLQK